jgi:hypothetical protein
MSLYLKKSFYSRDKSREEAYGSFFNKASSSLVFLINVVIAGLFAPVVIATSLASKDVALMLANIFLSIGYSSNFTYRLVSKEVSASELIITIIALAASLTLTFYFLPVTTVWNLVNIINFFNHVATAVNGFFLVRNIIIPPLKRLAERIANFLGFEIGGNYYSQRPLQITRDRFVIDRLFRKHYHHDVAQSKNTDAELSAFNNLLKKLVGYINKYSEPLFGGLLNADRITDHENLINQLTIDGSAENCIDRIEQKLGYKKTKIILLENARHEIQSITTQDSIPSTKYKLRFFANVSAIKMQQERDELKKECINVIDKELQRQHEKIDELNACLPVKNIH